MTHTLLANINELACIKGICIATKNIFPSTKIDFPYETELAAFLEQGEEKTGENANIKYAQGISGGKAIVADNPDSEITFVKWSNTKSAYEDAYKEFADGKDTSDIEFMREHNGNPADLVIGGSNREGKLFFKGYSCKASFGSDAASIYNGGLPAFIFGALLFGNSSNDDQKNVYCTGNGQLPITMSQEICTEYIKLKGHYLNLITNEKLYKNKIIGANFTLLESNPGYKSTDKIKLNKLIKTLQGKNPKIPLDLYQSWWYSFIQTRDSKMPILIKEDKELTKDANELIKERNEIMSGMRDKLFDEIINCWRTKANKVFKDDSTGAITFKFNIEIIRRIIGCFLRMDTKNFGNDIDGLLKCDEKFPSAEGVVSATGEEDEKITYRMCYMLDGKSRTNKKEYISDKTLDNHYLKGAGEEDYITIVKCNTHTITLILRSSSNKATVWSIRIKSAAPPCNSIKININVSSDYINDEGRPEPPEAEQAAGPPAGPAAEQAAEPTALAKSEAYAKPTALAKPTASELGAIEEDPEKDAQAAKEENVDVISMINEQIEVLRERLEEIKGKRTTEPRTYEINDLESKIEELESEIRTLESHAQGGGGEDIPDNYLDINSRLHNPSAESFYELITITIYSVLPSIISINNMCSSKVKLDKFLNDLFINTTTPLQRKRILKIRNILKKMDYITNLNNEKTGSNITGKNMRNIYKEILDDGDIKTLSNKFELLLTSGIDVFFKKALDNVIVDTDQNKGEFLSQIIDIKGEIVDLTLLKSYNEEELKSYAFPPYEGEAEVVEEAGSKGGKRKKTRRKKKSKTQKKKKRTRRKKRN